MMSFGFMVVAVIFCLLLAVAMAKLYLTDTRRMTSHTDARVVSSEQKVIITEDERRTETEIVARFTALGREIELKRVVRGERAKQFPPGSTVPVRYNPGRPWMADLLIE
ncbi:MAG TPA: DUF3592 domain-containing protein [Tepidisphaeraceae bacterium]|jgi:hypothetical protein